MALQEGDGAMGMPAAAYTKEGTKCGVHGQCPGVDGISLKMLLQHIIHMAQLRMPEMSF